jgi:hypothetical protein
MPVREAYEYYGTRRGAVDNYTNGFAVQSFAHTTPFDAQEAAPPLLGLAAPVTDALLGWVILRQSLSPVQLAGFVLTLGAIAYGAVLGASAAVGDDGSRELPDRVAHPVGDDQCVAVGRAGSAGSVEGGSLVGGEFEFDRGQTLVQLGDGGGADQRDHGNVTAHQPGQDHLVGGRSGLAGHLLQCGLAHRGAGVVELGGQGLVATDVGATQQG